MNKLKINGTEYEYKTYLPMMEKYEMATEAAALLYTYDTEMGLTFRRYAHNELFDWLTLKYYTEFDADAVEDFSEQCEILDALRQDMDGKVYLLSIEPDAQKVKEIMQEIVATVERRTARECSLEYKMLKTFGSLLTGEDIASVLAEATGVRENLMTMIEKVKVPTEVGKDGEVSMGQILSFAKKEK